MNNPEYRAQQAYNTLTGLRPGLILESDKLVINEFGLLTLENEGRVLPEPNYIHEIGEEVLPTLHSIIAAWAQRHKVRLNLLVKPSLPSVPEFDTTMGLLLNDQLSREFAAHEMNNSEPLAFLRRLDVLRELLARQEEIVDMGNGFALLNNSRIDGALINDTIRSTITNHDLFHPKKNTSNFDSKTKVITNDDEILVVRYDPSFEGDKRSMIISLDGTGTEIGEEAVAIRIRNAADSFYRQARGAVHNKKNINLKVVSLLSKRHASNPNGQLSLLQRNIERAKHAFELEPESNVDILIFDSGDRDWDIAKIIVLGDDLEIDGINTVIVKEPGQGLTMERGILQNERQLAYFRSRFDVAGLIKHAMRRRIK